MDAETIARMQSLATATPYGDSGLWVVGWVFSDREAGLEFVRRVARTIAAQNKSDEREYDPNVAPCDDAEFGMRR